MNALVQSPFFGLALSVLAYIIGAKAQKRIRFALCNTMIVAVTIVITVLTVCGVSYDTYYEGGYIINLFVSPATVCLAVGIYDKLPLLKKNFVPVMAGCAAGMVSCIACVWILCRLFGVDAAVTAALLPKSVTMPIATAVADSHGGLVPITIVAVIYTGLLGNLFTPALQKLLRTEDTLAMGLAIGASSHAMGTAKAIEMDKTIGAMSGLAIGVCGVIVAILGLFFGFLL